MDSALVPGVPGTSYEATWGRKTTRSRTFISRVYERSEGGGMQLWHCDHAHGSRTEAVLCGRAWARQYAAERIAAHHPPDVTELEAAVLRMLGPVEWG